MAYLVNIKARGARAFAAQLELELPERGVIRVAGDSGVGKSTLLSLPRFALGVGMPATKMQSWLGDAPLQVELGVVSRGRGFSITRGDKLKLKVEGSLVKGNSEEIGERLRRELDVPLEVVRLLSHRRQKQRSAFLSLPDEKKKVFLAGQAALTELEDKLKAGRQRVTAAEIDAERTLAAANATQVAIDLSATPEDLEELDKQAADVAALVAVARKQSDQAAVKFRDQQAVTREARLARVQVARKAVADADLARQAAADELTRLISESESAPEMVALREAQQKLHTCTQALDQIRRANGDRRRAWEAADRRRQEAVARGQRAAGGIPEEQAAIKRLQFHLDHLVNSGDVPVCSMCQRPWPEAPQKAAEEARAELARAEERLKVLEAVAAAGEREAAAAEPWADDPRISKLERAQETLRQRSVDAGQAWATVNGARTADAKAALTAAEQELVHAKNDLRRVEGDTAVPAELAAAGVEAQSQAQEAAMLGERLKDLERRRQRAQDGHARLAIARARVGEERRVADAALVYLTEQRDAYAAVRAFVARYFDQMLIRVSDYVNAMLVAVPNVRNCTVSFRSEVLNKDGEVSRQAIVPVLSVDGHEVGLGDDEGASGGMMSVIDLAVDLAVLQVLEERGGWTLGWIGLDEPFEGLDAKSREACVELLRQQGTKRLVLVVDHMGETEGMYDRIIRVTADGGRARVA